MAYIYWIRRESHSDITTQGYVGFTTQTVAARFQQHRYYYENGICSHYPVYRAMGKYDDLIITPVVEGSVEYCLMLEKALRPEEAMGWNIRKGGGFVAFNKNTSDETRAKLSKSGKGRKLSQKTKDRQSAARKLQELNFTDEQILARRKRTTGLVRSSETRVKQSLAKQKYSNMPWRNPHSNKKSWSMCPKFMTCYLLFLM
jgi:hypothetical protein